MKRALLIAFALAASAAQAQTNPFANNPAAVDEGRSLYNSTCTGCHGANGAAGEFGPGLAIPGRSYARRSDAEIFGAIQHGIPGTPMPAHQGKLTDDQIWKIA
ncbi:MAG: c-type cytochrome, partial [Acidobacteria bacterium]|nr:c-type cytochrome [Acidobacteriota bacterium]